MLKVGDKVRVHTWEYLVGKHKELERENPVLREDMKRLCGKEVTISCVVRLMDTPLWYYIKEDSNIWCEWAFDLPIQTADGLVEFFNVEMPAAKVLLSSKISKLVSKIARRQAVLDNLRKELSIYEELMNKL